MLVNGVMTIDYFWQQEGVIIYPDLIRITVAMDTGAVICFEAKNYFTSHYVRGLAEPVVSVEEAQTKVPENLAVLQHGMALIDSGERDELFCYEFRCRTEDRGQCLIYVNAETGEQERIVLIYEDENSRILV